jgi:hypothetical protein
MKALDLEQFKIGLDELEPLTNQGNIIGMMYSGNTQPIVESVKNLQNAYIGKCVSEGTDAYLDSLKQAV